MADKSKTDEIHDSSIDKGGSLLAIIDLLKPLPSNAHDQPRDVRANEQQLKNRHKNDGVIIDPSRHEKAHSPLYYYRMAIILSIPMILIICIVVFLSWVKNDKNNMVYNNFINYKTEIEQCKAAYEKNKCDPSTRVPSSEEYCNGIEMCIKRDPVRMSEESVAFTKVLVDNINKFWNELTPKAIICSFSFIALMAVV